MKTYKNNNKQDTNIYGVKQEVQYIPYYYMITFINNGVEKYLLGERTSRNFKGRPQPSNPVEMYGPIGGFTTNKLIEKAMSGGWMPVNWEAVETFEGTEEGAIECKRKLQSKLKELDVTNNPDYFNNRDFVPGVNKTKKLRLIDNKVAESLKQDSKEFHNRRKPFTLTVEYEGGQKMLIPFEGAAPVKECIKFTGLNSNIIANLKRGQTFKTDEKRSSKLPAGTTLSIVEGEHLNDFLNQHEKQKEAQQEQCAFAEAVKESHTKIYELTELIEASTSTILDCKAKIGKEEAQLITFKEQLANHKAFIAGGVDPKNTKWNEEKAGEPCLTLTITNSKGETTETDFMGQNRWKMVKKYVGGNSNMFDRLRKYGEATIVQRYMNTKHPFPVKTHLQVKDGFWQGAPTTTKFDF